MRKITRKLLREIDRRVKTALAFVLSRLPLDQVDKIKSEQCWLIGGSVGQVYTGNSAALHKYIVAHHPEIKIY